MKVRNVRAKPAKLFTCFAIKLLQLLMSDSTIKVWIVPEFASVLNSDIQD